MGEVESERKSFDEKSFDVGGEIVSLRRAELAFRLLRSEAILEESVEGAIFEGGKSGLNCRNRA